MNFYELLNNIQKKLIKSGLFHEQTEEQHTMKTEAHLRINREKTETLYTAINKYKIEAH